MPTFKRCSKCKELKILSEFSKSAEKKDGLCPKCKKCTHIYGIEYRKINAKKISDRKYKKYWDNLEAERKRRRIYYQQHKIKLNKANREYYINNLEKMRKWYRERARKLRSTPKGALNNSMSRAIWGALKHAKNGNKWEELVGYNCADLMQHLERKFTEGMAWENYGEWHIDHKVPVSVFNFETPENIDFKRCWALNNLQPMWAKENREKNAKIDNIFQPSLLLCLK